MEEASPDGLDLVLDLPFLPSRRRRAGGRLHHIMIGHNQEPAVEHALLASEHGGDRGLHVIVDAAQGNAAKERKPASMGIKHHLLRLARIGPDVDCP